MSQVSQVRLKTARFGDITLTQVFEFVWPILGFEAATQFCLLPELSGFPYDNPLLWLQSVQDPDLAFILTQPQCFNLDFNVVIPDSCLEALQLDAATATIDDIDLYTLVTLPNNNPKLATTNLQAPLIFSPSTGKACQWVINNPAYSTKTPLVR